MLNSSRHLYRIFLILLITTASAAILLSACSAGQTESPAPTTPAVATSTPHPTPTPMPTPTPRPTMTPTPSPTPEPTPTPTPEADRSAAYIYEANPKLTPVNYDSPALLSPGEDMGQAYVDRITFICDSPTYWMWPKGLLSGGKDSKQIWTGPEGTLTLLTAI